jgi:hypothetical protein
VNARAGDGLANFVDRARGDHSLSVVRLIA